jgi:fatty-acid desaturase
MKVDEIPRMRRLDARTNPVAGRVVWSPVKSLWFATHALVAVVGGWLTFGVDAVVVAAVSTVVTLCLGHSVGLHRLLVHRSFECPRWLELVLVHLGTTVGMGGPSRILYLHDIRDWAQRHEACHPYFIPWHNNHHAFPGSARMGLVAGQHDPGWWALCGLRRLGLVWGLRGPGDLPPRPERVRIGGE